MQNEKELTIFDNERRYIFTNWTPSDFIGRWASQDRIIKVGEIVELPMYLAYHYAKHLCDREMIREHKEVWMGVPEKRKEYIDKTIVEITGDTESPALLAMKEKLRLEIEAEKSVTDTTVGQKEEVKEEKKKGVKGKKKEVEEVEFADLK